MENNLGKWAFLIGLLLAVLAGFISGYGTLMALVIFVLGLVVGFLNVTEKESTKFLIASIALLVGGIASIGALSVLGSISTYISAILVNLIALVSAAALVVAIKAVFETSKR
ncbi:hypothetical protein J4402_03905 [Candidatus Pacearchaeota archaeon]|nr:hypothetical protein [Candidatus Pacearchaeota archaeon]